jgi:hypothetical protein
MNNPDTPCANYVKNLFKGNTVPTPRSFSGPENKTYLQPSSSSFTFLSTKQQSDGDDNKLTLNNPSCTSGKFWNGNGSKK